MYNSKISIIVPIYNTEKFLSKCIESLINQTHKNIEIILVNDGSRDSSYEICNKYKIIDERIQTIHKINGGVSSARNAGLSIATGEYITFVDSDDYISNEMYEKMLDIAMSENADIVECGYYRVDKEGNILTEQQLKDEIISGEYNSSYHYIKGENTKNYTCNKIYKADILKDIKFPISTCSEDFVVNVKAFYKCKKYVVTSQQLYYYTINNDSVCNRKFHLGRLDAIKNGKYIYEFHKERFSELCPFIARYIVDYCMIFYLDLTMCNLEKKEKYLNELENDFKLYYPLIKGEAFNLLKYKRKVLMKIFHISRLLYKFIYKLKIKYKNLKYLLKGKLCR